MEDLEQARIENRKSSEMFAIVDVLYERKDAVVQSSSKR